MKLTQLTLTNFRSYTKKTFAFPKNTTLITGSNAAGKTNIIEAIYFLATGKSFRIDRDRDVINWKSAIGRIQGSIEKGGEVLSLELVLTTGMVSNIKTPIKKFLVNGVSRRNIDFIGNMSAVLFWPQDLDLVTGSPSIRRNYLDSILVQIDREYRRSIRSYERGLRQRNRLLKKIREGEAHRSHLLFWDQLLIKEGSYITTKRKAYVDFVNHKQWIQDCAHRFDIAYDPSHISEARIKQYEDAEVASAATLVGPHRDDMKFKVQSSKFKVNKEQDLSSFGSRGEQRLGVLWLKLAELSYLEHESQEQPLLLLDDIFSELDHEHRNVVFSILHNQQTIITTADTQTIPKKYQNHMEVVELQ